MKNSLITYEALKDGMRTGDVIVYAGDDLVGRLIRMKTSKSHVSLIVRLPDYEGSEKRRFILEAMAPGIVATLLSKKLEHYNGRAWWYRMRPEFEPARIFIGQWAFGQLGTRYDFGGLFKSLLGRVSENAKALFCSEFAFSAARQGVEALHSVESSPTFNLMDRIYFDWMKIDYKAAWPGDFETFTRTYEMGGQIL